MKLKYIFSWYLRKYFFMKALPRFLLNLLVTTRTHRVIFNKKKRKRWQLQKNIIIAQQILICFSSKQEKPFNIDMTFHKYECRIFVCFFIIIQDNPKTQNSLRESSVLWAEMKQMVFEEVIHVSSFQPMCPMADWLSNCV